MAKFIPGKFQFVVNNHVGGIFIYDVFGDGHVREKDGRSGVMRNIPTDLALKQLDDLIKYYEKCLDKYKNSGQYSKIYQAKIDIHKTIYDFIKERE